MVPTEEVVMEVPVAMFSALLMVQVPGAVRAVSCTGQVRVTMVDPEGSVNFMPDTRAPEVTAETVSVFELTPNVPAVKVVCSVSVMPLDSAPKGEMTEVTKSVLPAA